MTTFYLNSKVEIINNEIDVDDVFKSIYTTIISNIQKCLGKSSGWIIDLVIGSSYMKLLKELDHPR